MKRLWLVWSCLLSAWACAPPRSPAPLFECRVPVEPLMAKLEASGGEVGKILHPRTPAQLALLESGQRYKFVVGSSGRMAVAPLPADAPGNEYVHPVLAGGAPVLTAGGIRVERHGATITRITVDQDSKAYCPTGSSLEAALAELGRIGLPGRFLRVENRPPVCVGAEAPAGRRYGELMAEVGRRFERLGRAARVQRVDLANFEVGEIGEIFADDLPKAEPPRESAGVNLAGVAWAFVQTNLPELEGALRSKDMRAFKSAYGRAAETCNSCHRASGHPFIEVPTEPGLAVPKLDPVL